MHIFQKFISFVVVLASLISLLVLPEVHSLSNEATQIESSNRIDKSNFQKLSPKLSSEVILHGFLLWSSMGFLMPIGILVVRMSNISQCGRRLKVFFYFHVIILIVSVLLGTAGAVLSVKHFENNFNNNHQRIGLGLYGIIWVQALMGFFRPERGSKQRSMWFFMHWLTGTVTTILGILNIYTGLEAYSRRTSKSVRLRNILFTAEVCVFAFFYLLQDKWLYMKQQGVISGDEPIKSLNQTIFQNNDQKDLDQRRPNQTFGVGSDKYMFQ